MKDVRSSNISVYLENGIDEYNSDKEHWYAFEILGYQDTLYIYKRTQVGGEMVSVIAYPRSEYKRVIKDYV